MNTMTEDEKQAKIAELKKIPRKVQLAVFTAFLLGLITFVRFIVGFYASHRPIGKGVFYAFLMLFWFFIAGSSLAARSRWGFIGLLVLVALPIVGIFGLSIHLLRLALEGTLAADWPETIHCAVALAQFVMTCILIRYLLARQVRDYVWKPAALTSGVSVNPHGR
jgi:hypothetical protein